MERGLHMKTLWSVLSRTNQPVCPDQVGPYIEKAQKELILGLQIYKARADFQHAEPETSVAASSFTTHLSQVIRLEETLTAHLLSVYKESEFRGTPKQFDSLMKTQHLRPGLLAELSQFYHNERSYLLHCVEYLIQHSQNLNHPYYEIFFGFMETFNSADQLKASLIEQLKVVSSEAFSKAPSGPPALAKEWQSANIRERILLLQCLIRYNANRLRPEDVVQILSCFSEGIAVPLGDLDLEVPCFSLLRLHSALLVKALNVSSKERFEEFRPHASVMEEALEKVSNRPEYAPVLLAWMLMHYTHAQATAGSKAQLFGEKAVGQRVLKIVADIANDPVIQGKSSLRDAVCSPIHDMMRLLIDSFDTERLSSPVDLRSAAAALLRSGHSEEDDGIGNFWAEPTDQGLHLVWRESAAQFPAEGLALLQLARAIAESGPLNRAGLVQELDRLPFFVEPLDNIPESILKWTANDVVIALQSHYPYRAAGLKDVLVTRGTAGQLEGKCIRWEVKVSLFDVAICDFQLLLQQASFGLSAIKLDTLVRVQKMLDFLELVYPELAAAQPAQAEKIQHVVLSLIERFGGLSSTTSELLASCFQCLAASVMPSNAYRVASKLLSFSSILPSLDRAVRADVKELDSARLMPGVVGTALAGIECPQGSYPLTAAFLKLMTAFVQTESIESRLLIPSTLFILREIFPYLLSWPYGSLEQRDEMITLCLNFLHRILQTEETAIEQLKKMCVQVLMESEADCLPVVATYGPSLAEMQLMKQTNWEDTTGRALVLLRQIRTALSILNQLLHPADSHSAKPRSGGSSTSLSKLETVLSAQKFVTVLASYIFHRFDLRLATLSLRLLRSCAIRWTNVSLLACLGQDAPLIRRAWLACLESHLEDVGLIKAVLRLMTDAVAGQPGLMHMLVNGENRCLEAVARLLEMDELEALRLVHQFWTQACCPAIEFFRERDGFWTQLCRCLMTKDKASNAGRAALVFQMVATETYNKAGRVDPELEKALNELPAQHLPAWTELVLLDDQRQVELLSGWSDFIVMQAHYGPDRDAALRSRIRKDVLEALIRRVESGQLAGKMLNKLASLHWMMQLVEKNADEDIVDGLGRLLVAVAERGLTSFTPRFQAALLTCAVSTVRLTKCSLTSTASGKMQALLGKWMRPAALCAQACLVQLPALLLSAPRPAQLDNRPSTKTSCITALCLSLLAELIPLLFPQELPALREAFLLQTLVSTVQFCLHHQTGTDVAEASLAVLLAVGGTESGSAALTSLQLDQSLWLPLEAVYQALPGVYRLGVQLCSLMLTRQRHFFLDEALTFVGVHRSPLTDALLKLSNAGGLARDELSLAVDVMALLGTVSKFQATWRLQPAGSCMQTVLPAAAAALYFAIAHLTRSKLSTSSQPDGEEDSPAMFEVQSQLLDLISQGLSLLNCYSPPLAALLTEDGIDVAKWDRHLSPSFGSPSLEHGKSAELTGTLSWPTLSFGTLNAAGSHCLRLLSRPEAPRPEAQQQRGRLNLVLELSLSLILSQALLYILDPRSTAQEKQLLKRELGAELGTFVESLRRQAHRGLRSPAGAGAAVSRQVSVSPVGDQGFLKLVGHIVQRIFK